MTNPAANEAAEIIMIFYVVLQGRGDIVVSEVGE